MENDSRIGNVQVDEIRSLVDKAISAYTKKDAESYIQRLSFIRSTSNLEPPANNVFGELISYVHSASGQVHDKSHWTDATMQSLYKLQSLLK